MNIIETLVELGMNPNARNNVSIFLHMGPIVTDYLESFKYILKPHIRSLHLTYTQSYKFNNVQNIQAGQRARKKYTDSEILFTKQHVSRHTSNTTKQQTYRKRQ